MTSYLTLEVSLSDDCEGTEPPAAENEAAESNIQIFDPIGDICDVEQDFNRIPRSAEVRTIIPCAGAALGNLDHPTFIERGTANVYEIGPLTVGKTHYFFITHIEENYRCPFSFRVLQGSTAIPELTTFTLDHTVPPCLGETVAYTVTDQLPLTDYVYTLNSDTISTEAFAEVTYDAPGTYELCISGSNLCSAATPNCYTFTVDPPITQEVSVDLCPGDCYVTADTTICDPGSYTLDLVDRNGCDSTVRLDVQAREAEVTELTATICSGDTLEYLETKYFADGIYPIVRTNRFGCDSTINLQIELAACPLSGNIAKTNLACHDGTDGRIRFALTSGRPPYRYDFRRLGGGPAGSGTVARRNDETTLSGLPPGTYLIEVTDDFGSVGYFNTTIERPAPVSLTVTGSDYNGQDLSCTTSRDGVLTATASGGTGKFDYRWSETNRSGPTQSGLAAGSYSVTATDANGCTADTTVSLSAPPPLRQRVLATDEDCDAPGTGGIALLETSGGTGVITTVVTDGSGNPVRLTDLEQLTTGDYLVRSTDANGCNLDTTVTIGRPLPVEARISPVDPTVGLGDSITLTTEGRAEVRYTWRSQDTVVCADCPQLTLLPLTDAFYVLTATSAAGCTARDTIRLTVDRNRNVYVPTAFSPNGGGTNDALTVYPGRSVRAVVEFAVYDRWGGLVYAIPEPIEGVGPTTGWDGLVAEQRAPAGMYAWVARIVYLDGVEQVERGSVALIR
jgi:gliding motility-associated-like protein